MLNRTRNFDGIRVALVFTLIIGLVRVNPALAGVDGEVSKPDNATLFVHIQTPSSPIHINGGESKLVPLKIAEAENISGTITNRTYQFFTQYDVPLSEPFGPFPASIEIAPLDADGWNELVFLPKAIANQARSMKEYAIVLKTTFNGSSASGEIFSADSSLLLLLPPDAFSKASPADGALVPTGSQSLQWNSSVGAVDYEYCFDTINNDSCDSNWTGTYWLGTYDTNAALQNLPPGTTFYWQVRANNTSGTTYANNGDWWEFTTSSSGVAGNPDPIFDGDGLLTTPIGGSEDEARAVAIQPDGKIVVVGRFKNPGFNDFFLARYNSDGTPDSSFDSDGVVVTDFGNDDVARAVVLQSDGKIVVAGYSVPTNSDAKFAVARYHSNGLLDNSFDADGKLVTDFGGGYDYASGVAVQSDGKIVVVGAKDIGINNYDVAVARYTSNGLLDTSFDGDGLAITPIGTGYEVASSVAIQPDGKIIVGGVTSNGSNTDFVVLRYNDSNGSLDSSFNGDGIASQQTAENERGGHIALQLDEKILIAGDNINGSFLIARYDEFGLLDPNFGTGGMVVSTFSGNSDDQVQDIVLQQDNKIILAGYTRFAFGSNSYDFALARFNSNGSPDNSFSSDGKLITDFGFNLDDLGNSVAIQTDGKIVVAGYRYIGGSNFDVAIARYIGDSILSTPTPTPTLAPTFTPSLTSSPTFTPTFTPTNAGKRTSTPTLTSLPPTATRTPTPLVPTVTFTPTNTATRTNTPVVTATYTPLPTNTTSPTFTSTVTPTNTPIHTLTNTATFTPTNVITSTPTVTPGLVTLVLQPDGTNGVDSYIYSGSKSLNFGTDSIMGVGEDNNITNRVARSLIKFDLSSIPANATITSATLSLWTSADLSSNDRVIRVYRLKVPFNETQVTWSVPSSGVSWQVAGASGTNDREIIDIGSVTILNNEALNTEKQIVLTPSKIQELVNGTFANNGFILVVDTEQNDRFNYSSSDTSIATHRPRLVIQYTIGSGVPTSTPTLVPTFTATIPVTPTFTSTVTITGTPTNTGSPPTATRTPTRPPKATPTRTP